jgi:hypothetical protein
VHRSQNNRAAEKTMASHFNPFHQIR